MSNGEIDKDGLLLDDGKEKEKENENLEDLFDLSNIKTEEPKEKTPEKPKEEESDFLKSLKNKPEEVIGKLVKERLDQELGERERKSSIAKDIKEIDSMPDVAENKKTILGFMKENPMLAEGFIAEAHKKGENPLKNILNYVKLQKGGGETEIVNPEEAPATVASAVTGKQTTANFTPEQKIAESVTSVKKKGEGESIFFPS